MKSKTCWFNGKLFKNTLKRYWWFGFLVFLTSFFSVSVHSAVLAANAAVAQAANPTAKVLDNLLVEYFTGSQYIVTDLVLALAFGAAAGLVFFGYLHNKRQADFFHGQPVSRETQISTRFLTGCVLYAAAYVVNLLFAFVIMLSYGASAAVFGSLVLRLLLMVLAFASLYALSILCAALTGNPFAHLQMGFILSFGGTLLMCCLEWMADAFLQTFRPIAVDGMFRGSLPVYMIWKMAEGRFNLLSALCVIVVLAVVLILSVVAYRKRPVEFTGGMLAFPKLQPAFRAVLCLLTGTLLGAVFYSVLESIPFCIFGLILGTFLGHMLCQGQFNRSFGGMFTSLVPFAATAAVLCAVTACFMLDVTKFDQYVPAQSEIRCVGMQIEGEEPYFRRIFDETGNFVSSNSLETVTFDDPEVVGATLGIAHAGVDTVESRNKPGFGAATKTYTIRYTLQNGKQVQRCYEAIPDAATAESLQTLLCADAYTAQNDLLHVDISKAGYVNVITGASDDARTAKNAAEKQELLSALREDLRANGRPIDQLPLGRIDCEFYATEDKAETERYGGYRYMDFNIYGSYTNTIAVLEGWGVKAEPVSEEAIENAKYLYIRSADQYENILFETEDPAQIRTILQSGQVFSVSNNMTLTEPVYIEVLMEDENGMSLEQMEKQGYQYALSSSRVTMETKAAGFASYQYNVRLGGLDKLGVVIPG